MIYLFNVCMIELNRIILGMTDINHFWLHCSTDWPCLLSFSFGKGRCVRKTGLKTYLSSYACFQNTTFIFGLGIRINCVCTARSPCFTLKTCSFFAYILKDKTTNLSVCLSLNMNTPVLFHNRGIHMIFP